MLLRRHKQSLPIKMTASLSDLPERIRKRIIVDGECWLWPKPNPQRGYGYIQWGGRRSPGGHREPTQIHIVVYRLLVGEVPPGHVLDHACRKRACCRPVDDHVHPVLEAVNSNENSNGITAQYLARTHCTYGHDLNLPNAWYYRPDGRGRMCRECNIERGRGRRGEKPIERLVSLP